MHSIMADKNRDRHRGTERERQGEKEKSDTKDEKGVENDMIIGRLAVFAEIR